MAPFAAQYASSRGRATWPPIELMLMIRPDFWGISTRPAVWQHRKTLLRLTAMISSHSASVIVSAGL